MKQLNPRSSEKSPAVAVATLIVTVCATKKFVSVTLRLLNDCVSQNAQTCAALVLTDLSTPHSGSNSAV